MPPHQVAYPAGPTPLPLSPDAALTSRAARVVVVLTIAILLVVRLPRTVDLVARTMPPDVVAEVGDAHLVDLAVHIGALLGLGLTLVSVVVFLAVAALLERHLSLAVVGSGRWRLGGFTAVAAACLLVTQLRGLLSPPTVEAGLVPVALSLTTGLVVALGFAWLGRARTSTRGAVVGVLAAVALALAMSVTTLSV